MALGRKARNILENCYNLEVTVNKKAMGTVERNGLIVSIVPESNAYSA
jgi:hypothetical protein